MTIEQFDAETLAVAAEKAGDLELAPVYLTEREKQLQRAGFPVVSDRAAARDELKGLS